LKGFIHYVYFVAAESKLFASKRLRILLDDLIILPTYKTDSSILCRQGMKLFTYKTSVSRRYKIGLRALLPSVPHDLGMDAMLDPSRCSNANTTFPEAARREQN
jgi:hypothetical protein